MKKYIILILLVAIGVLSGCKKDGDMVILSDNVTPPVIVTLPSLILDRNNAADTLLVECSAVDPGFTASANYYLEACVSGDNFANKVILSSGVKPDSMLILVSDLNSVLAELISENQTVAIDLRVRSVLVVDGGTGAPGTGDSLFEYISDIRTTDARAYGPPRLQLINSGYEQYVYSKKADGIYEGVVVLSTANPFTITNLDDDVNYGATGTNLVVNGSAIVPASDSTYYLIVDLNTNTYSLELVTIGLVGTSTPNGWDGPDIMMDYDIATGTWNATTDLVAGEFKFRKNNDWAWNLGGTEDNLTHNGSNIALASDGNYTIVLTITNYVKDSETGTFTIVQN